MTDLYEIQRQIVYAVTKAPTGSALKFKLMDAADAMSKAIEAQERAARTDTTPQEDAA